MEPDERWIEYQFLDEPFVRRIPVPVEPEQQFCTHTYIGESGAHSFRTPTARWKAMCEGCGAPLQRTDIKCSYCTRATGL